jgi:hypothetical protein
MAWIQKLVNKMVQHMHITKPMKQPDKVIETLETGSGIYAWYRGDVCLYVGSTVRLGSRLHGHEVVTKGWQKGDKIHIWYMEAAELYAGEFLAMLDLKPALNKRMPTRGKLSPLSRKNYKRKPRTYIKLAKFRPVS